MADDGKEISAIANELFGDDWFDRASLDQVKRIMELATAELRKRRELAEARERLAVVDAESERQVAGLVAELRRQPPSEFSSN
jgi:hypothetical protein